MVDFTTCLNSIIAALRDPSNNHPHHYSNIRPCHKRPQPEHHAHSKSCALNPTAIAHYPLSLPILQHPTWYDAPPPEPPHAIPPVRLIHSEACLILKPHHQPIPAKCVSSTNTTCPMVVVQVVVPVMAPNICTNGSSIMKPDNLPDQSTPFTQYSHLISFSMLLPSPASLSIHFTEFLLENQIHFHRSYVERCSDTTKQVRLWLQKITDLYEYHQQHML